MKRERVLEYARMVLGPVRFTDPRTRSETVQILHNMLNEEVSERSRAARHPPKPADPTLDAARIAAAQRFSALELAKAGYLAPWKTKLARLLRL